MNEASEHEQRGSRATLARARTIVVKVGSNVLTRDDGGAVRLNRARVYDLAADVASVCVAQPERRVILVSSGAVAAGLEGMRLAERPSGLATLQAAAAVGQPRLMAAWHDAFAVRGVAIAQLLLTRHGFDKRDRYLNIRNCLAELLPRGVVPIANENDTVATEEITLGDNDYLAAKLAVLVEADALVLLSTAEGVRDGRGEVRDELPNADAVRELARDDEASALGTGGMTSKAEAAAIAAAAGASTLIAPGHAERIVSRTLAGERLGTLVPAQAAAAGGARKKWLQLSVRPAGQVTVDAGAARAVTADGASLLARGCVSVRGSFSAGDPVAVVDPAGGVVAHGLINFASSELLRILGMHSAELAHALGRRTHAEVIHRDNLVVVTGAGGRDDAGA